jgi:hypothetical protein
MYSFLLRTIALIAIIILLRLFLPQNGFLYQFSGINVSFAFLPLLYILVLVYAGSLVGLFFVGDLAAGLSQNIQVSALPLLLFSIVSSEVQSASIQSFVLWFTMAIIVGLAYRTVRLASSSCEGDPLRVVSRGFAIFFEAIIVSNMIYSFFPSSQFGVIVLAGIMTISFLSFLGVLSGSINPYSAYIGKKIAGPSGLFSIWFLITLALGFPYFGARTPSLISGYLPLFVVGLAGLVFVLIYRDVRNYARIIRLEDSYLFNWGPYLQNITRSTEDEPEASKILNDFVDTGSKEKIGPYLVSALLERGLNEFRVAMLVQGLLRYSDPRSPKFTPDWMKRGLEASNKRRRASVLRATLDESVFILEDSRRRSRSVLTQPVQTGMLRA